MKIIALFIVLCAGLHGSRGGCPIGFQQYNETCYRVFTEPASWIDAKKYCQVFGGDLVQIDSQAEETRLETVLNEVHVNRTARIENYWVDGSDVLSEGEWRWVGTPGYSQIITGYTHWAPSQPDNDDGTENCMQIRFDFTLFWNDEQCSDLDSFICEAEYSDGAITGEIIDVLGCPEGFERHGYRCYKVFAIHVSWIDAKQYCQIYGADLVQIDSAAEETIVEGIVKRLHGAVGEEVYWTDGTDLLTEGEWRWAGLPGESRLIEGYTHWHPNQPDNAGGENCLEIRAAFGFDWNDHQCSLKKNFICETAYETAQVPVIG